MNPDKFIEDFKSQFIDGDSITVDASTDFRQFDSWDSLTGMAVLVMIKDEYGIDITDSDLKKCKTVGDIISLVSKKSNR